MRFSDRQLRALKPKAKLYDVNEGNGFVVRVQPSGVKTFYYVFRMHGKLKRKLIGRYGDPPLLTLAQARTKHARLVEERKSGGDPTLTMQIHGDDTIEQMCADYIEYYAKRNKKTWEADKRALELDVLPLIGQRKAGSIKRRDIVALLERKHASGAQRQVNIVHTILSKAFSFALQRDFPDLEFNPCRDIPKIGIEKERDRVLTHKEIRAFWDALSAAPRMSESTKRCLRFILLTGQRSGECLHLERSEIADNWWTQPADKTKTSIVHRVYLTETAKRQIGTEGKPFPIPADPRALNYAVRRICAGSKIAHFTPHDLRRTAATLMAENGVSDDHVDRVLGHKMGKIRRTYNRHTFDEEKKNALLILESALLKISSTTT